MCAFLFCVQVTEMYSSGGELHIELLSGQPHGSRSLWVGGPSSPSAV